MRTFWLLFYYTIARNLPDSYLPFVGKISNSIRIWTCRRIFARMGRVSTIQKGVFFGDGRDIQIGDYSGIGKNAVIPNNTIIGNYVMIAQNLFIVGRNHATGRVDVPMVFQGNAEAMQTVIGDDVWIGANVVVTGGRRIANGVILAAGCVLTKDPGEYEIWGGNPGRCLKSRLSGTKS